MYWTVNVVNDTMVILIKLQFHYNTKLRSDFTQRTICQKQRESNVQKT